MTFDCQVRHLAYDLLRIGAWALVIVGALLIVVGLIGYCGGAEAIDAVSAKLARILARAPSTTPTIRTSKPNQMTPVPINYVQTATDGEILCRTVLDRRNRTTAVLRSEVLHEDGRLLATAIGSA